MWRPIARTSCLAVVLLLLVGCDLGTTGGGPTDAEEDTREGPDGVSCLAVPSCDVGDRRVYGGCPDTGSCYTRTMCGSTITCLRGGGDAGDAGPDGVSCLAEPTCDRGDAQVDSCPDTGSCYTRTECGSTVTCLRGGGDAGSPADAGDTGDAGGSCPPPSSSDPDAGCLTVVVCCYNETTGEKCSYANPCVAPEDPGSEWTCGSEVCSRDAGS